MGSDPPSQSTCQVMSPLPYHWAHGAGTEVDPVKNSNTNLSLYAWTQWRVWTTYTTCLACCASALSRFLYWWLSNKGTRTGLGVETVGIFKSLFLIICGNIFFQRWGLGGDKSTTNKIIVMLIRRPCYQWWFGYPHPSQFVKSMGVELVIWHPDLFKDCTMTDPCY